MKKAILILGVVMLALNTNAQKGAKLKPKKSATVSKTIFPVKGQLVKVADWHDIGTLYLEYYWVGNKASIVKQIGKQEFEWVKNNCDENKWPNEFRQRFDASYNDITPERFKYLKMYKIATFVNTENGKKLNTMVILRVPFEENKDALPKGNWDGENVYFILKATSIL